MKKLSLLFTLTLAALCTSGCDLLDIAFDDSTTPTNQQQNSNEENKPQEESQNGSGGESENNSGEEENGQEGENQEGHKEQGEENQEENNEQGGEEQGQEEHGEDTPVEPVTKYIVSFQANGGYGLMPDEPVTGTDYRVPNCEFTRSGYSFVEWALNGPEGDKYLPGSIITNINQNITLYVIWEEDSQPGQTTYVVSFEPNGGSGIMVAQQTENGSFTLPDCEFTFEGHSFDCWALNSVGGAKYNPHDTINEIEENITLFAIWVEEPPTPVVNFTVTFNANGGTGSMSPQNTQGSNFDVPACYFIYEDHLFNGWALNSPAGVKYSQGSKITDISSDIILYATWVEDTTQPISGDDTYYSQCAGLTGSALQAKLLAINAPESPSYDWSRYEDADEAEDDSSSILCVYTRHNIKKSNHCGSYSWTTWNREHVWTQSLYPKSKTDNHNIFACEGQINNYRGNLKYNEGGETVVVFGHVTECKLVKNTSFEPCDAAKGEIARSVMYGTVMYSYTMTNEIQSIELALKWHLEHEITSRETKRNEIVYRNQGNRNPFVDHPEYACKIWGGTNSATKSLCGIK